MDYQVLGGLHLNCEHRDVEIGRPKSRMLLALLLCRANHVVPTVQLIEELWFHRPPPSARTALRVHVTHLRQALAVCEATGCPGVVEGTAAGYQVTVDGDGLDALRFESAVRLARQAESAGASAEVVELLEPALEWWHGPAYSDLRDLDVIAAEATRLDDLRLGAIELLADAKLAFDLPHEACRLLEPATAENPLRESLAERLMLALYRSSRGAEALRVFARLRDALDRELGVAPGRAVRDLEVAIVMQRPGLDLPAGPRRSIAIASMPKLPIVGRRSELRRIDAAWAQSAGMSTTLALVSGPAGIGKTTLVDLAAHRMTDLGGLVFRGGCDPDAACGYEPFSSLVRDVLASLPRGALTAPLLGELRQLTPERTDLPPLLTPSEGRAGQHRLFAAVTALLDNVGELPIALILEDLHWASSAALALLRHLLRASGRPLLIVGTYRTEDLTGTPLEAALSSGQLTKGQPHLSIPLDGLDVNELTALIRVGAPEAIRDRLLDEIAALHELTNGNPLYVREAVQALSDSPDGDAIEDLAPGGVRALLERKLRDLPTITRESLEVAAVLGRVFSVPVLASLLDRSPEHTLRELEVAGTAGLVEETGRLDQFRFCHPLIRNTIYSSPSASRRARLHLHAAEVVDADVTENDHTRTAQVAHHLLAARPLGPAAPAATAALNAGDEAEQRYAFDEAATWYEQAIELAREAQWSDAQVGRALLRLGRTIEQSGQRESARDVYLHAAERARAANDAELMADIAVAATPRYVTVDDFQPMQRELVDEALALAGGDPLRRAWLLCCASATRYYDVEDNDEPFARESLTLARGSDDPEVRAVGLLTYHRWLTHDPEADVERLSLSRELVTICEQARLDSFTGRAYRTVLIDLLGVGELDAFDRDLDVFADFARSHGIPADVYWVNVFRATRALMVDPFAETEDLVGAARTIGREFQQGEADGTFLLQSFALRYEQGRSHEISKVLDAPQGNHPRLLAGLAVLATAYSRSGREHEARRLLDRVVIDDDLRIARDNLWLGAAALYSGVAAELGTPEQQRVFLRVLAPFAHRWCVFGAGAAAFGTGDLWLGRLERALGHADAAAAHFGAARRTAQRDGAKYWEETAGRELAATT